jgi:centrosomal protein CEP76
MISPLFNIRGIDSPNHALRFCSLIPFVENQLNKKGIHKRFSSILGSNEGSVDDHCHLLCSLLLGFGLKAYVCIGNSATGEHSWVMCESNNSIVFWETTKGIKMDYYSAKTFNYYKTIHTVYNHKEYYVNIQLDDSLASTKFNFKDFNCWKAFDQSFLEELSVYNHQLCLFPPTLDVFSIEQNIESNLSKLISEFRQKNKLSFELDGKMSSILSIALANYEIERVTGNTFC